MGVARGWGTLTLRSLRSRAACDSAPGSARAGLPGGSARRLCRGRSLSRAGSGAAGRVRGWCVASVAAARAADLSAGSGAATSRLTSCGRRGLPSGRQEGRLGETPPGRPLLDGGSGQEAGLSGVVTPPNPRLARESVCAAWAQ